MPNKSVTNMFLHKTFETNSSFQQKEKCALHGTSRWQLQFNKNECVTSSVEVDNTLIKFLFLVRH